MMTITDDEGESASYRPPDQHPWPLRVRVCAIRSCPSLPATSDSPANNPVAAGPGKYQGRTELITLLGQDKMPKITPDEYQPLKEFWVAWEARFPMTTDLPPEHHPVAVLERFEKESMARARSGLGMAISDTLEMSWDMSAEEVQAIDAEFSAKGILPLSELRRRYSRQFKAIIKRGKIGDEEEYYLIAGILASFTGDATEEERQQLEELVSNFEGHAKE